MLGFLFGGVGGFFWTVLLVITIIHIVLKQPKMPTLHKVLWIIASFFVIGLIVYWILWLLNNRK